MTPNQILKNNFGFNDFRPGQEEIIEAILNDRNVLAVMPTGAGKSICYQIPAILNESFSIVISPLISLMQDQVYSINKEKEHAAFINSTLDYSESRKVLGKIEKNKISLLYLSPEKLNNREFTSIIKELKPHYIFVDEAHCISEWGHNFRPSYRNIKNFAESIGVKRISAFTATATPDVREDIIKQLEFKDPKVFVYGFERENLSINVLQTKNKKEKVLNILKENNAPTIIYTSTRKNSELLDEYLKANKINSQYYHAGLSTELRKLIQDDFIKNNIDVIVATNAFGMGIDKSDIGTVIHYNIPGSIENLYQEFGRAGRNGNEANAYLFFSNRDKFTQEFLIKINFPNAEQIKDAYDAILDFHRISVNSMAEKPLELSDDLLKLLSSKSISSNLLHSIIHTLEENKYMKFSNGYIHTSKFSFLVNKEKLKGYIKDLKNKELQEFILILLQYYGSVPFSQEVKVNYDELKSLFTRNKNFIDEQLDQLSTIGIIDYNKPNLYQKVVMLQERVPRSKLRLNLEKIESMADHSFEKLDALIEYCFTDECRFKYILNYFGESAVNYKCNKCDNCTNSGLTKVPAEEYISELIIRTFNEFKGALSLNRVIGILKGKSKSHVAKSISTYESCAHYDDQSIADALQKLIAKKVIKEIGGNLYIDPIEELIDSEEKIIGDKFYETNLELFNKLREERNTASKKFSQSPEIICPDNILRKIAHTKPKSPSEMMAIEGINQRMFNKIGVEFLEIIKEHKFHSKSAGNSTELPQHIHQTYELAMKGYSLNEISRFQKLPESIVSIQLETIISYYPDLNYNHLIPKPTMNEIKQVILEIGDNLKDIKEKLGTRVSYAEIRIVKALLSTFQS